MSCCEFLRVDDKTLRQLIIFLMMRRAAIELIHFIWKNFVGPLESFCLGTRGTSRSVTYRAVNWVFATRSKLQIAGSIRYSRGHISVVERIGLEARACECYGIAKWETDRLLAISRRYTKVAATQAAVHRIRIERSDPTIANASANIA